jgi:WD40 repeat protein
VVDLVEQKVDRIINRHRSSIEFIAFTKDGKCFVSRSKSETIIWDLKTWRDIITIEEDFGIVTSTNRYCIAFIHDGLYKPWTASVLKDFSDDFVLEEDEKTTQEGTS